MRRVSTILVVLALLATPMALLAHGMACGVSQRDGGAYCAWQASHSSQRTRPMCGRHSAAGELPQCCQCMMSQHSAPDFGVIAPMAPTHVSLLVTLAAPGSAKQLVNVFSQALVFGVFSAPFEPPRS